MTKLIPKNVSFSHNSGRLFTELVCEELVTIAEEAYEVTCPSTPDNEPEQPQEEVPQEDPWPDIGIGDVLTRNSWRSGGLFESVDDPIAVKSVVGMSTPTIESLNGGAVILSNVVSSNNYIYWITGLIAYRHPIKSGGTSKSFAVGDYTSDHTGITLIEEGILARTVRDTPTNNIHLIKVDFETETETILASVTNYVEDEYLLYYHNSGVYTIVGSDNKIYLIFCLFKYIIPPVGDSGFTDAHFYIYNYTDDILYDPVVLDIWDTAGVDDIIGINQWEAPAIVHSEIVFTFHINFAGSLAYTSQGVPFYCINVENQTGQVVYQSSYNYNGTVYVPDYQYRMVSDRMYRRVYCNVVCDAYNPSDITKDDYPIFRYDLATNSVNIESHHLRVDIVGPAYAGNLPFLIQDKNYAYKLTNLYCADTTGGLDLSNCSFRYPLFSRITALGYTVLFDPPALPYWPYNEYDIDDVTGDLYTLDTEIDPVIWVNRKERGINIAAVGGASSIHLQGDHIIIQAATRVMWVAYN